MTVTKAIVHIQDDTKFGIIFCRKTGQSPLTIQTILPGGAFYERGLVPGMVVTEVNGKRVQWETPVEAAMMLQNSMVGTDISVTAETFTANVHRDSLEQRWGLYLKRHKGSSGVIVGKVSDLFENTELKEGMKIIEINGEPCPKRTRDAFNLLKESEYDMQITAVDLDHVDVDINWPETKISGTEQKGSSRTLSVKTPGITACTLDDYVHAALAALPSACTAFPSRCKEDQDPRKKSDPSLNSMRGMRSIVFPLSQQYNSQRARIKKGEDRSNCNATAPKPKNKTKKLTSFFQVMKQKEVVDTSSETSSMEAEQSPQTKSPVAEQEYVVPEKKRKSFLTKLRRFRKAKSRTPASAY
jgi:hypothetical protein